MWFCHLYTAQERSIPPAGESFFLPGLTAFYCDFCRSYILPQQAEIGSGSCTSHSAQSASSMGQKRHFGEAPRRKQHLLL